MRKTCGVRPRPPRSVPSSDASGALDLDGLGAVTLQESFRSAGGVVQSFTILTGAPGAEVSGLNVCRRHSIWAEQAGGRPLPKSAPERDPAHQDRLAHFERLIATIPGVECKGAANPYTSLNGHMFSYLHPGGSVALRLPPGERETFLARFRTTLFHAYGVVQKEYVTVPDALLEDTAALGPYFRASYDYVAQLKPKSTSKAKRSG